MATKNTTCVTKIPQNIKVGSPQVSVHSSVGPGVVKYIMKIETAAIRTYSDKQITASLRQIGKRQSPLMPYSLSRLLPFFRFMCRKDGPESLT